jgi:hypothetical protein
MLATVLDQLAQSPVGVEQVVQRSCPGGGGQVPVGLPLGDRGAFHLEGIGDARLCQSAALAEVPEGRADAGELVEVTHCAPTWRSKRAGRTSSRESNPT